MAVIDIASFNPATATPGTITNPLPDGKGKWVVYNDSPVGIIIAWGLSRKRIIAGWADIVDFCNNPAIGNDVTWSVDMILSNAGAASNSIVQIDGYTPNEIITTVYPVAIPRIFNLGNTVPIATSASSVVNSGNPAPTAVVTGTPSGAPGSELLWNNDGSGKIGGGLVTISAAGVFSGASIDGSEITTGTIVGARIGSPLALGTIIGSVTNGLSFGNIGGGTSGDSGMLTTANVLSIAGPNGAYMKGNNYWNGTNDIYIATGFANQVTHGVGDYSPKFKSALSGTAGTAITWFNFDHIPGTSTFSGSGSGTYSHGLNHTPQFVGVTENVSNSTTTVGVDSIGSTTVHVNIFGGALAFVAVAMAV